MSRAPFAMPPPDRVFEQRGYDTTIGLSPPLGELTECVMLETAGKTSRKNKVDARRGLLWCSVHTLKAVAAQWPESRGNCR